MAWLATGTDVDMPRVASAVDGLALRRTCWGTDAPKNGCAKDGIKLGRILGQGKPFAGAVLQLLRDCAAVVVQLCCCTVAIQ